jgi:hypothetical protein
MTRQGESHCLGLQKVRDRFFDRRLDRVDSRVPACVCPHQWGTANDTRMKTLQSVSCMLEGTSGLTSSNRRAYVSVDNCTSDLALDDEESFEEAYRRKGVGNWVGAQLVAGTCERMEVAAAAHVVQDYAKSECPPSNVVRCRTPVSVSGTGSTCPALLPSCLWRGRTVMDPVSHLPVH